MTAAAAPAANVLAWLAAPAGSVVAVLHFAGALKSLPVLGRLPLDLTAVALAALLPMLAALGLDRRWRLHPGIGPPLVFAVLLLLWLVVSGAWSASRDVADEKLIQAVLLGPILLLAGLLIGADPTSRDRLTGTSILIGILVGAGVALGLAADALVLGGRRGADPERVRVAYQVAGLAIASAAALAAVKVAEARRGRDLLLWAGVTAGLGAAALVPGGRLALLGLMAAVLAAPAARLVLAGRFGRAVGWAAAAAAGGLAGLAILLATPEAASSLRTIERLVGDPSTATSARAILWGEALHWAGTAAPFGLGAGGFPTAAGFGEQRGFYPHNHALEAMAEGGLPGLVFWLGAFGGGVLFAARQRLRVAPARVARIVALTLPLGLTAMVSTDLGNRMIWFGLGLVLSLGIEARRA